MVFIATDNLTCTITPDLVHNCRHVHFPWLRVCMQPSWRIYEIWGYNINININWQTSANNQIYNSVALLGWSIYRTCNTVYLIWTLLVNDISSLMIVCWESLSVRNLSGHGWTLLMKLGEVWEQAEIWTCLEYTMILYRCGTFNEVG